MPQKSVARWLFVCTGMVFVMVLLGGITRLTGSGLSITDWNPIMGAIPPLSDAAWQVAFAKYQAIPQYRLVNNGMPLETFKTLFFWEWFHRLWGRLMAVVVSVPPIIFLSRRQITWAMAAKFGVIFLLGALQGLIGWIMVKSGLSERTSVSPYLLSLHLSFALMLYSVLLWVALEIQRGGQPEASRAAIPVRHGWLALLSLTVTIVWGAFVAGMHAGLLDNTWPLMEGFLVPPTGLEMHPVWVNAIENPVLVQFVHRWLGPFTMLMVLSWVARCWPRVAPRHKGFLAALGGMALVQVGLGMSTLLSFVQIDVAVLHQAGAITLLTLLLINLHRLAR